MAFKVSNLSETDEAETVRLASSPDTSLNGRLAQLPMTIKHPRRGMLIELPWQHTENTENTENDGQERNWRIIVLLDRFQSRKHEGPGPHLRNGSWHVIVVASTHPLYPPGGYDLVISESEARRSRYIEPDSLLSIKSDQR